MVAGCQIDTEQPLVPDPQPTRAIAASILRATCGCQSSPASWGPRPGTAKLGQDHAATSGMPFRSALYLNARPVLLLGILASLKTRFSALMRNRL